LYGVKEVHLIGDNFYIKARSNIIKIDHDKLKASDRIDYQYLNVDDLQRIFGMAESPEHVLWYSTLTGVYKFTGTRFVDQPQFKDIRFKNFIFYDKYLIGYTHNNQLLICSDFDKDHIVVDTVPYQNCIWDKLYKLDKDHVLVSTNNIYRLLTFNENVPGKRFTVLPIEDPFIPKQAENICMDTSNCYFFKNGNLTIMSINNFLNKAQPPKMFFTFLKTSKRSLPVNEEVRNSELQISYSESKNISLSFSRLVANGQSIVQQYSVSKNNTDN
jgi:hypothetical protein